MKNGEPVDQYVVLAQIHFHVTQGLMPRSFNITVTVITSFRLINASKLQLRLGNWDFPESSDIFTLALSNMYVPENQANRRPTSAKISCSM